MNDSAHNLPELIPRFGKGLFVIKSNRKAPGRLKSPPSHTCLVSMVTGGNYGEVTLRCPAGSKQYTVCGLYSPGCNESIYAHNAQVLQHF